MRTSSGVALGDLGQVVDGAVDHGISIWFWHDLANHAYTVAAQIAAEARSLSRILDIGVLDGGNQVCTKTFDVFNLGA